jgi:hypothetical protein
MERRLKRVSVDLQGEVRAEIPSQERFEGQVEGMVVRERAVQRNRNLLSGSEFSLIEAVNRRRQSSLPACDLWEGTAGGG